LKINADTPNNKANATGPVYTCWWPWPGNA